MFKLKTGIASFLLFSLVASGASTQPVTDILQSTIVRLYSEGNCKGVRLLADQIKLEDLRPNVLAVAAYCEPTNRSPEELFKLAEERSTTGDLILLLHGKWLYQKNPEASKAVWGKVLINARNTYFKNLAKEYLTGVITPELNKKPLDLSPNTTFASVLIAGIHRTNPIPEEFSYLDTQSSYGTEVSAFFSKRQWFGFGSLAYRINSTYDDLFQNHTFSNWNINTESNVAIHVADAKDIIFRPFVGYRSIGGTPFEIAYGLGVSGVVYKKEYVQSVEATLSTNHIFLSPVSSTAGAHYRFDYNWEFYPSVWTILSKFYIEHLSADPTTNFLGRDGTFIHSYNKFAFQFNFEREVFDRFTLQLIPSFFYRTDTGESTFASTTPGVTVKKGEQDFGFELKETLSMPIAHDLRIYAWHTYTRLRSSLGATDYADRNYKDSTFGLGIRTWFSTY